VQVSHPYQLDEQIFHSSVEFGTRRERSRTIKVYHVCHIDGGDSSYDDADGAGSFFSALDELEKSKDGLRLTPGVDVCDNQTNVLADDYDSLTNDDEGEQAY
jgi:hypothetical protein